MSDLQVRGALWGGSGAPAPFTAAFSGAQRVTDAHGRYMDAVLAGRVYFLSSAATGGTAYVGAAAGTPLFAIHNPASSGKILVVLAVGFAQRATATGAGTTGLVLWSGPSVLPTGTQTTPTSALSLAATGAAAKGFSNAALTGSTALTVAMPLHTHYWATAAAAFSAPGWFDVGGLVIAVPGNQIALGLTVIPTAVTVDSALYWEEIPYLT